MPFMKQILTNGVILIAWIMLTTIAQAQSRGLEGRQQARPFDGPAAARTPDSLSRPSFAPPESHVPPRSPDLGSATSPLSPSIGPGSGLLGPESGRGPMRLRSDTETRRGGSVTGGGGR